MTPAAEHAAQPTRVLMNDESIAIPRVDAPRSSVMEMVKKKFKSRLGRIENHQTASSRSGGQRGEQFAPVFWRQVIRVDDPQFRVGVRGGIDREGWIETARATHAKPFKKCGERLSVLPHE